MELVNQRVMRAPPVRFKLPGEFKNRFRKNGTAVELSEPTPTPSLTQSNRTISPDQLVSPKSDILAQIMRKTGVAGADTPNRY